jgi:exonuclease VII large subunit
VQLHQKAREIRAASGRGLDKRGERVLRFLTVLERKLGATRMSAERSHLELRRDAQSLERATDRLGERRLEKLASLTASLNVHDPQHTLERGYALALGADGEPLANAEAVRAADEFDLRMADATVPARIREPEAMPADAPSADAPVADAPVAAAPTADAPVADAPTADPPAQPTLMQDSDSDAG